MRLRALRARSTSTGLPAARIQHTVRLRAGPRRSIATSSSSPSDSEPVSAPASLSELGYANVYGPTVAADGVVGSRQQQKQLPAVDWSRYHLQVLFIDRTDQLRARLAAGLFEKVAEWNGYGRALYPWTCGVTVDGSPGGRAAAMAVTAGLMSQAVMLGIPPKVFARSPEAFELRDLDGYDVVVAVDSHTRDEVLRRVEPKYETYYRDKVHLLSDYAQQQPLADSEVLRQGGLALLPRSMSRQLQDNLPQLRHVVDVPRPCLADATPEAIDRWNWMVLTIMLGAAGLVRYLIDAYPDDLPEYDPL